MPVRSIMAPVLVVDVVAAMVEEGTDVWVRSLESTAIAERGVVLLVNNRPAAWCIG